MSASNRHPQTPGPESLPSSSARAKGKRSSTAKLSPSAFIEAIRSSDLLNTAQREYLPEIEKKFLPDTGAFAKDLVRRGWLTRYQLEEIINGRGKALILGAHHLLELLGEGGMGTVYKARHFRMDRIVSLKIIRPDLLTNAEIIHRFHREVRAAARLSHPNVVMAYDADQLEDTHYLAMEYVDGIDLARAVKVEGPLSVAQACAAVRQVALALQHAHEHGMVHRDVKPSNLLRARDSGIVKLLDLGLALLNRGCRDEADDGSLTQAGALMGTPDYMAPEQALDTHRADIRSDLYSLGCTFYFLLTGQVPFPGGSIFAKICRHRELQPEPVTQLRPNVPPDVAVIIGRLMAKAPDDRYQTPAELIADLDLLLQGGSLPTEVWSGPAVPVASSETADAEASTDNAHEAWATIVSTPADPLVLPAPRPVPVPARRNRWRTLAVAGIAVAVVLALVAAFLLRTPDAPKQTAKKVIAAVKPATTSKALPKPKEQEKPPEPMPAPPEPVKPPEPPKPVACLVRADRPWQDTHVQVEAGKPFVLTVSGEWSKGKLSSPVEGLPLTSSDRNILVTAAPMALLARIGDDGPPFAVAKKMTLAPKAGGRLYVQANTLDVKDNAGTLQLEIEGGTRQTADAPPPKPTMAEAAEAALPALLARVQAGTGNPQELRAEVLAFRSRYPGATQSLPLAAALKPLPSELDKLVPAKIPRRELFAWQKNVVAVLGEHRWWHGSQVNGIAISPDGKHVATAGADGLIRVWDMTTGKGRTLRGHTDPVNAVTFSANGKTLLSGSHLGSSPSLRLWNVATGKETVGLTSTNHVYSLASHENRMIVAGTHGGTLNAWDLAKSTEKLEYRGVHSGDGLPCLAFSADGKYLASGGADRIAKVFNVVTNKGSQSNQLVALKERHILRGHVGAISALAFSPDGQSVVTGSVDSTLKVWASGTGAEKVSLQGHKGAVTAASFTLDGKQVISVADNVRWWDPVTGLEKSRAAVPPVATAPAAFSRDRKTVVAAGQDGQIQVWEAATGKTWGDQHGQTVAVTGLAFAPDGVLAAAGGGALGTIKFWDLLASKERSELSTQPGAITSLAGSHDGKLLTTAGADYTIKIWDRAKNTERGVCTGHAGRVTSIAFSADDRLLASASHDLTARIWDASTGKPLVTLKGHKQAVIAIAFAAHGRFVATGSEDGSVKIWDVETGEERLSFSYEAWPKSAVGFTPDGRYLAIAQRGGSMLFLDVLTGKQVPSEIAPGMWTSLLLLPDGKGMLVASLDGRLDFWDFSQGVEGGKPSTLCQMNGGIYALALAPDGRHVAAGHAGGTIQIFRLPQ